MSSSPCINTGADYLDFSNEGIALGYDSMSDAFDPIIDLVLDAYIGCAPDIGAYEFEEDLEQISCVCDGESCIGCTDDLASNYNPYAIMDDGSCEYDSMAPEAFNFEQSTHHLHWRPTRLPCIHKGSTRLYLH